MGYKSSSIKLQETGLFKAIITYQGWFSEYTEHETFVSLEAAEKWILMKRCPDHTYDIDKEKEKEIKKSWKEVVEKAPFIN